jgi:hypothetical protein
VRSVGYLLALATTLLLAGCGSGGTASDGASSSTTATSTNAVPAMTPAPPTTGRPQSFKDYLASIGVTGEPVHLDQAPGLAVTVPVPDHWARSVDPLFSTGVEYIQPVGVEDSLPSVTLMAIRLTGDFDPKDAIRHANADALPPSATVVTESFDDYDGFPSAVRQGMAGGTAHYNRIVLAEVPSTKQRYLVQLTVAASPDQPIAASPELSSIIGGLKVTVT